MFDNIPLTALALKQGGYDWGPLAYAVGFGGSMIGLDHPQASQFRVFSRKPNRFRVDQGRVVCGLAYLVGFAAMLAVIGWHLEPKHWPQHGRPERVAEPVTSVETKKAR